MTSLITTNPNVLGSRPVFRDRRVPVEIVFENLADGLSLDEIVTSYPSLNREDVIAVIEQVDMVKIGEPQLVIEGPRSAHERLAWAAARAKIVAKCRLGPP
jgi:uncharacterized protein (DUF433 family)